LPGKGLPEAPGWPTEALDPDNPPSDRVFAYWDRIWCEYPQSHIWKRQRMEMQVATYCRLAVLCASANARSTTITMFKQLGQELLITPHAMRAARIIIDEKIEEPTEERSLYGVAPVIQLPSNTSTTSVLDSMMVAPAVADDDDDLDDEEETNDDDE
jgi:hypothetical protein